jgi:hypothetical protein
MKFFLWPEIRQNPQFGNNAFLFLESKDSRMQTNFCKAEKPDFSDQGMGVRD